MKWNAVFTALAVALALPASAQSSNEDLEIANAEQRVRDLKRAKLEKELVQTQRRAAAIAAEVSALDAGPASPAKSTAIGESRTDVGTKANPRPADKADDDDDNGSIRKFAGLKFGAGLSVTRDLGGRDRIGDVRLDANRRVRVFDRNNTPARVMVESHYFFTPCHSFLSIRYNECEWVKDATDKKWRQVVDNRARWGWGPFVALQPGGNDVIDAIGAGLMVGFRRGLQTNESFNLGFGIVVDPNTKVLARDIEEGGLLPPNETDIRLEDTTQTGLLFLASFSF